MTPRLARPASREPTSVAVADIDLNGSMDLIVADAWDFPGQVRVLANRCASSLDLRPVAIEVTQSIQDLANSVVLVGGRRTVARVYVESQPHVPVSGIEATLFRRADSASLHGTEAETRA